MADYFESGTFADGVPAWHNMGTVIDDPNYSIERALSDNSLLASPVDKLPCSAILPDGRAVSVPGRWVTVRRHDRKALGVVGKNYHVVQTPDAYAFLADVVDDGDLTIVTCGTLRGGADAWMLFRVPGHVDVAGDARERVETFLLVANNFSGERAMRLAVVHVRVVCANTLAGALNTASGVFKVRHTVNFDRGLTDARTALGIAFNARDDLAQAAGELAQTTISDGDIYRWLDAFVPAERADGTPDSAALKHREGIVSAWQSTPDLQPIRDTRWGLVQAAARYQDHGRVYRASAGVSRDENRMIGILGGRSLTTAGLSALAVLDA